jgi:hypothetical protein
MRCDLSRRLKRLEQNVGVVAEAQPLIIVRFIKPNGHGGEPCQSDRAECHGQAWQRKPEETPQDFKSRVMSTLQKRKVSPTILIFFPGNGGE